MNASAFSLIVFKISLAKICLNLLVIIPFLTNSINPPPLLSLFLQFRISKWKNLKDHNLCLLCVDGHQTKWCAISKIRAV